MLTAKLQVYRCTDFFFIFSAIFFLGIKSVHILWWYWAWLRLAWVALSVVCRSIYSASVHSSSQDVLYCIQHNPLLFPLSIRPKYTYIYSSYMSVPMLLYRVTHNNYTLFLKMLTTFWKFTSEIEIVFNSLEHSKN